MEGGEDGRFRGERVGKGGRGGAKGSGRELPPHVLPAGGQLTTHKVPYPPGFGSEGVGREGRRGVRAHPVAGFHDGGLLANIILEQNYKRSCLGRDYCEYTKRH